jgi:hypothetical protein
MIDDQDNYETYYANKLWALLPAIYRALDTDQYNANGPLRELVNRIGAQAAILRRSIDRLWEDQSIETCDDWVIPYIGDLLATNLVTGLDTRSQRIDVARTIYYRRRKGTLGVLEEIAANITGWDAKVVEFFRRLGRTRHSLDPEIGLSSAPGDDIAVLQAAEGLVGSLTGTGIGGLADLRNVNGATMADTAFDEFFHTADFRQGQGRVGWYGIPRLGVFLWRLTSFRVGPTTPVHVHNAPGWYTFDPTGRDIPLFAASRIAADYGDNWVSPSEEQLPTPISQALFDAEGAASLYHGVLGVFASPAPNASALPLDCLQVRPPSGRFFIQGQASASFSCPVSASQQYWTIYYYGFPSEIGAGPYDRRVGQTIPPAPSPQVPPYSGGGNTALTGSNAIPAAGTATIADSLTYTKVNDVSVLGQLTVRAGVKQRPVIRPTPRGGPRERWKFTGQAATTAAPANCLVLDGLFLSGTDIVLDGTFDCVTLSCCTLDPGSSPTKAGSGVFAVAADGRHLVPCRLWIEGTVGTLTIDRSITGPIHTRGAGQVETLSVTNSILQAIPTARGWQVEPDDIKDLFGLIEQLLTGGGALMGYLRQLAPGLFELLSGLGSWSPQHVPQSMLDAILDQINALLAGPSIYNPQAFQGVPLSAATLQLLQEQPTGFSTPAPDLNRSLLDDALPEALADAALALTNGDVNLSRCTVLGRVVVHRLQASECILRELAQVDDTQHGCVRFTAWAAGSVLPRQFESASIPQGAPLFTSTDFGQPGYGQLLPTADATILPPPGPAPPSPPTILAGAEDGSEMGAFARDMNPIKERGLLIKYQEYMPAGLVPVLIYVT